MPIVGGKRLIAGKKTSKVPYRALGVHIKAGGFSLGMEQAGFKVVAHLEATGFGVKTAKLNWPRLPIYVGEKSWPLAEFRGKVEVVISNPACAPFSCAGVMTTRGSGAWRGDKRMDYWRQCSLVFERVEPIVFVLESLCTAYSQGREVVDDLTRRALGKGYSVTHLLVNSRWTGMAQSRNRFFFIAHKVTLSPSFDFRDPPTVGDVLSQVSDPGPFSTKSRRDPALRKMFLAAVRATPPGGRVRVAFDEMGFNKGKSLKGMQGKKWEKHGGSVPGRPGFLLRRLNMNTQFGTFLGNVLYHPTEDRLLGVNEQRALCGYPVDFKLSASLEESPRHLSKAVLPPVGRWVGEFLREGLSRGEATSRSVTFLDLRDPGEVPENITYLYVEEDSGKIREASLGLLDEEE